jgi:hypothetical protein
MKKPGQYPDFTFGEGEAWPYSGEIKELGVSSKLGA